MAVGPTYDASSFDLMQILSHDVINHGDRTSHRFGNTSHRMRDATRLITEQQVAEQMGKRGRHVMTATVAGKRLRIRDADAARLSIETSLVDVETRETLIALLAMQKEITTTRSTTEDPRRVLALSPKETCAKFAEALETIVETRRDLSNRQQCIRDAETWRLFLTLLNLDETSLTVGVVKWVQQISKRTIYEVLERSKEMEPRQKSLTIMGWLVAANLDLDAIRLAMAEGEVDLAQVLICRPSPEAMHQLMRSYVDHHRNAINMHPLMKLIMDFLAGQSDALLETLGVDWRVRLGASIMRQNATGFSLRTALRQLQEERPYDVPENDVQYLVLKMFAEWESERGPPLDYIRQVLQTDSSSIKAKDGYLKWQMYLVLSAAGAIKNPDVLADMSSQLYRTMHDLCEEHDLFEWSAFVCLHQSQSLFVVKSQILRILGMHTPRWKDNHAMESFLLNDLSIPSEWMLHLKGYWYKRQHMVQEEFDCLIALGAYDEAHTLLLRKILPEMVQSTASSDLEPALKILRERHFFQQQHQISQWSLGGSLFQIINTWLEKDLASHASLSPLLDEMNPIDDKIREAKQFWVRLADSNQEKSKVERMYDILSYHVEKKYSEVYAMLHGEEYIMTRILNDKCKKQEVLLNFLR